MIELLALAFTFAICRALDGGDYVPRPVATLLMGLGFGVTHYVAGNPLMVSGIAGLIVFLGMWLGLLFGWQLAAIHSRYDPKERNFWPADMVGNWVFKKTSNGFSAGVAFFTVRAVMFYPVFAALAFFLAKPWLYASGLAVFTMGGVYWLAGRAIGEKHATRLAEYAMGAIWGAALWLGI